ncbi:hypothetical protein URS_0912 [Acinetobacter ursingii]|nr:hypothetical protein URS_0912 [Acinetobacter ursingii]
MEWIFIDGSHVRTHQHSAVSLIKPFLKVWEENPQKYT